MRKLALGARVNGYSVAHSYQIRENVAVMKVRFLGYYMNDITFQFLFKLIIPSLSFAGPSFVAFTIFLVLPQSMLLPMNNIKVDNTIKYVPGLNSFHYLQVRTTIGILLLRCLTCLLKRKFFYSFRNILIFFRFYLMISVFLWYFVPKLRPNPRLKKRVLFQINFLDSCFACIVCISQF